MVRMLIERRTADVLAHPDEIFKLASKSLKRTKNIERKALMLNMYSFLILREISILFPNGLWTKTYRKNIYCFLFSSYVITKNPIPYYLSLASLYFKQVLMLPFALMGKSFSKIWNKIFDYQLNGETLVLAFFKKTFHFKLTPFTRFFIRHLLHFKNDVDLIYLYCDGNDLKWQEKRRQALKKADPNWTENGSHECRYADNNELKYSLRSAEMFAPWIHKIYIITDGQKPEWLDTSNRRIKIVDLKDIMPKKYLPCFNSNVIESFMYKIKGLSEYFLYGCDDMFFFSSVTKDFFFSADGKPCARLKKMPAVHKIIDSPYLQTLVRMSRLYQKKSSKRYFLDSHHNIDAYTKSFFKSLEKLFSSELKDWRSHKFRTPYDFQRILLLYQALGENTAILKFQSAPKGKSVDSLFFRLGTKNVEKRLSALNPKLFCINDSEQTTDKDRKNIQQFYQKFFPYKSSFEK